MWEFWRENWGHLGDRLGLNCNESLKPREMELRIQLVFGYVG